MTETPKCPYCGGNMEPHSIHGNQGGELSWYSCQKCEAISPNKKTKEAAIAAALRRTEPENRVLTLEEIYAKIDDEDWNVVWIEGPDSQKAEPMCPYYKEENKIVFCAPPFVRVWEETISRYGKSWRCWPRKPTPEQMAAEKWEE